MMQEGNGENDMKPESATWNRLSLFVMGAGVLSLIAAAVLFVFTLTGDSGYSGPETTTTFGLDIREVIAQPATPTAAAEVEAAPPSESPIVSMAIPKFDIDAPIVVLGVDDNGVMETPDGPLNVAWYDFSARPGFGSNAVFSGHVDYYNYGPAVFWNLKDLEQDDIIELRLQDGTVYEYEIISRNQYKASDAPIAEIVGRTDAEVITLITCGGTFDPSVGQYDDRVVVRAQRVYDDDSSVGAQSSP